MRPLPSVARTKRPRRPPARCAVDIRAPILHCDAANKRFATMEAAWAGLAHPGDPSRPVALDCTEDVWQRLFGGGADTVDLRTLADTTGIP